MLGRERGDVMSLFSGNIPLKVCAPMVRYSKLEFRNLVRKYGCQLCFTPMIIADSFVQSEKARHNEFTTSACDTPLIVQFAANNVDDYVNAAELISPFSDGVDLNCGCPQRWAIKEGYGSSLLSNPEAIRDMVRTVRHRLRSNFTVSVKIRILDDLRKTIEMSKQLEAAGLSFLTVHGRTPAQRGEPVNIDAIKAVVDSVRVPVIANGDVKDMDSFCRMHEMTNCNGIMSAQGLLSNPALFSGCSVTPLECVEDWLRLGLHANFQTYHHHLVFMLEKVLSKPLRVVFNNLKSVPEVHNFLQKELGLELPADIPPPVLTDVQYHEGSYFKKKMLCVQDEGVIMEDASVLFG